MGPPDGWCYEGKHTVRDLGYAYVIYSYHFCVIF
jgi:hypothetical protein